jgi:hypothetical protein
VDLDWETRGRDWMEESVTEEDCKGELEWARAERELMRAENKREAAEQWGMMAERITRTRAVKMTTMEERVHKREKITADNEAGEKR